MFGRFSTQDAKAYTTKKFEELRPEYEKAYPHLDHLNNTPELSNQQTQLQDVIDEQNRKIQGLEQRLEHDPFNERTAHKIFSPCRF